MVARKGFARRQFIKGTVAASATAAFSGLPLLKAGVPEDFIRVGICRGTDQAQQVAAAGAAYLEPSVQRFLVPDQDEDVFLAQLNSIRAIGLETPACNSFLPRAIKVVGPERDMKAVMAWVKTAFERAGKAGVKHIVFGSGNSRMVPEKYSRAQAKREFVEVLEAMAPIAQQHGVTVCIEPLRSSETNFINTLGEGAELCEIVNHRNVGLVCDYYHVTQEGHGPAEISRYARYIQTMHIAEHENRQPPGTHGDDFRPVFAALKDAGFTGNCSIECRWTNIDTQGPLAVKLLREQIADVAVHS